MYSGEIYRAAVAVWAMAVIPSLRGGVAAFCLEENGLRGGWWYESPERWVKDHGRGDLWAAVPDVPDLERCCVSVQVGVEERRREVERVLSELRDSFAIQEHRRLSWEEDRWQTFYQRSAEVLAAILPFYQRQRDALARLLDDG